MVVDRFGWLDDLMMLVVGQDTSYGQEALIPGYTTREIVGLL